MRRIETGVRLSTSLNAVAGQYQSLTIGVIFTISAAFVFSAVGLRFAVFTLLLLGMAASFNRAWMLAAVVTLVPFVPLLRRIIGGVSGADTDPLSVVLLAAIAVVLVASMRQLVEIRQGVRTYNIAVLLLLVSIAVSLFAGRGASLNGIFAAAAVIVCTCLTAAVAAGAVPDVWPFVSRWLPSFGVLSGAYGLFQFYLLPSWDKVWMLNSGLRSIGQAIPMQVRIFGPSEAPGPYAFFLGLCVTIALTKALTIRGRGRVTSTVIAAFLLFPMLVSGVRTAILGVVIALCAILILRTRGAARLLPIVFLAGLLVALNSVLGRLSSTSTLFAGTRYGSFNAATDTSFQQRLELLSLLKSPQQFLAGRLTDDRYDNVVVDLLVNLGILAAIGLALSLAVVAVAAVSNLRSGNHEVAAASALFALVTAASGNIYLSGFGILAAIAFGSTLRVWRSRKQTIAGTHPGQGVREQRTHVQH